MSFRSKLVYFLVHHGKVTNKTAKALIRDGKVTVNDLVVDENIQLPDKAAVSVSGMILRAAIKKRTILFHKPRGYESTFSAKVDNNLSQFMTDHEGLIIAGRLDKDSEGLLLLSNDGKWVENICRPGSKKEKEYLVELDRTPDALFFDLFQKGVLIGNYITQPCVCESVGAKTIRVVLQEGKNRQIRRMCWNLGFDVITLKRIRIDKFELGELKPGTSVEVNEPF